MKDELSKIGMSNADFGSALIEEAQRREKQKYVDSATVEVSRLLSGMEKMQENIKRDTENLNIYSLRLDAIKKGNFKFTNDKLVYDDERLNKLC